jgi:hypothetical protein
LAHLETLANGDPGRRSGDPVASQWLDQLEHAQLVLAEELMLGKGANTRWKLQRSGNPSGLHRNLQVEALARREAAQLISADQRLQRLAATVLP